MRQGQKVGRGLYLRMHDRTSICGKILRPTQILLTRALVVRLSQVASELALGLKPHMEPLFVLLVSLQPKICAVPRGHYRSS